MGNLCRSIDEFIDTLAGVNTLHLSTNQYSNDSDKNIIRRENLRVYLNTIQLQNNKVLLVGEAAGYKGCLLSGIPFTSEWTIKHVFPKLPEIFKNPESFEAKGEQTEPSATIVWEAFQDFKFYPLLWNAFPFHPYKTGNKEGSNRKPNAKEIDDSKKYIDCLRGMFNIKHVGAIGRVAEDILKKLYSNEEIIYIRHPANAGKKAFRAGVEKLSNIWRAV
jgi:uracil-DNA glycosylase